MTAHNKKRTMSPKLEDLFEEKERLEHDLPELHPSFEQFLKDFREYEAMRQLFDHQSTIEGYLLYGAQYRESE